MSQGPRRHHAEMKAAILQAARAALLERGPERFALRDVARRCGYSPAGLYEYFRSKEDLITAVASESLTQLFAALIYAGRDEPPLERLVAMGLAYIRFAHEHPQHFMLIGTRRAPQPTIAPNSPFLALLHAVQAAIDAGAIPAGAGLDVEELAYGLWSLAHGIAMLQQTHLGQTGAQQAATDRRVLEQFVRGLGRG